MIDMDLNYLKYYEARRWAFKNTTEPAEADHQFARFYAESDWDDPKAAWADFNTN